MIEGKINNIEFKPTDRSIGELQKGPWFQDAITFVCQTCGYVELYFEKIDKS